MEKFCKYCVYIYNSQRRGKEGGKEKDRYRSERQCDNYKAKKDFFLSEVSRNVRYDVSRKTFVPGCLKDIVAVML